MKVLVLGGNRYIGRHLVFELANRGHEVTVLSACRGPSSSPLMAQVVEVQTDGSSLSPDAFLFVGQENARAKIGRSSSNRRRSSANCPAVG